MNTTDIFIMGLVCCLVGIQLGWIWHKLYMIKSSQRNEGAKTK